MEAFEYAIKKDIRNNPIVREVDEARLREMLRSTVIGVFVVAIVLYSAWQHFELVRYGYRIERPGPSRSDRAACVPPIEAGAADRRRHVHPRAGRAVRTAGAFRRRRPLRRSCHG